MTHLHEDTTPGANGWTLATIGGVSVYTKQRTFADGSYFTVQIYGATGTSPLIYSQGYVRSPFKANQYISRSVQVTTTNPANIFTKALAATGAISFNGNGTYVDSYDSRIGPYNILTNRGAAADIATDSTATPAVNIGNGNIFGKAATGPGGSISVSGGAIGDVAWNISSSGAEPGWTNNNIAVQFPSNSPPTSYGSYSTVPSATTVGGTNAIYMPTGSYTTTLGFGSSGTPLIITGNVTLVDTGDFTVSGGGSVIIMPGASLRLYVGGSAIIGGNGVVNNPGYAANFSVIGLPTCTQVKYSGGSAFNGTVNAPQADITITGGGAAVGALIGKTVTVNGGGSLHYDVSLAAQGSLVATGWKEL